MTLTFPNPFTACRSFCEINHKIQGVVDKSRNPVDNPAALRAGSVIDQIYFYVLFCVCIFFYYEQVAPHYCGAIPEFVLLYLEVNFGTLYPLAS